MPDQRQRDEEKYESAANAACVGDELLWVFFEENNNDCGD
jgi:hypothetical protein